MNNMFYAMRMDGPCGALNFSWVVENRLAGCRGPRSDDDLVVLRSAKIQNLVRLAHERETGLRALQVQKAGLVELYEPVPDFTAPTQAQIDRVVRFIRGCLAGSTPVAVSCNAGYGRTGTMLACYFVSEGYAAISAIDHLLRIRPVAREIMRVPRQREAISEFARRLQAGEANLSYENN